MRIGIGKEGSRLFLSTLTREVYNFLITSQNLNFNKKAMNTLHIKINNKKTYQDLLEYLKRFNSDELQFVEGKGDFVSIQRELTDELSAIDSGNSSLMELEE